MTILIIDEGSNQAAKIRRHIENSDRECLEINTHTFFKEGGHISASYDNGALQGEIRFPHGAVLELANIDALYTRGFHSSFLPEGVQDQRHEKWAIRNSQTNMNNIIAYLGCAKMNCPQASLFAINKGEQYRRCADLGILTPPTLISNCKSRLERLIGQKESIVHKAMASIDELDEFVIYTNAISQDDIVDERAISAVLSYFQEYITKDLEIRCYVVGDTILACEIHSQKSDVSKVDWRRFDIARTPHFSHVLPNELEIKLKNFVHSYGLFYGAIDLILNNEGQYFFLELNPDGIYDWIEELVDLPISMTIANWLITASEADFSVS
jgi:glutathione synthase/RimK-type ligase-like ATP-grasp enzyme